MVNHKERVLAVTLFLFGVVSIAAQPLWAGQSDGNRPRRATFAGGCFWCMEPPFDSLDGVISTTSGYIGGHLADPTYEEVSAGVTGHAEAVEVVYDPATVSYAQLLRVFWRNIDPFTRDRQFCDRGSQYRAAIFFHDVQQERLARQARTRLQQSERFKDPIVTKIVKATRFYPAEKHHQNYYQKHPIRYRIYKFGCGRSRRLKQIWDDTLVKE